MGKYREMNGRIQKKWSFSDFRLSLLILLVLVMFIQIHPAKVLANVADGNYDFSGLGSTDSGGSGYQTLGDKFLVSNGMVQDGTAIYDNQDGSLELVAEGTGVVNSFTFKDFGISGFNASTTISSFSLVATHSNHTTTDIIISPPSKVIGQSEVMLSFLYNGNAEFNVTDVTKLTFNWTIDSGGEDTLNFESITIANAQGSSNSAPVAVADTYSVNEDQTLNETTGVLANDTDADPSDTLSAVLVSDVSDGTLSLQPNGTFTYTPDANFSGTDSFTYKANDGSADSNTVTVTITVNAVNDAPVAVADTYNVNEDQTLNETTGVLDNDTDAEGDTLTAVLVSDVSDGTLSLQPNGTFTYTPDANFSGTDSFTYKANDGTADSNTVTATITVNAVNDVPVAVADTYSVNEDQTLNETTGVLANDTDADPSDTLSAVLVSDVSDGTLSLQPNGTFTYTPDANFSGTDSFTYKANDGTADSNTVTATITVNAVNDAPVAVADTYNVNEDQTLNETTGVLDNDTDAEGDTLTAVLVSDVSDGTLSLQPNGTFTYTPDANFSGTDSFTYKANDGTADSNTVTVTITVNAVNDVPVAVADTYSVNEDQTLNETTGVLANDTDADPSDTLSAVLVSDVSDGTLSLQPNGTFTYTPDANFSGTDSFTYKANDGSADSNTVTVTITVNAVNDAPVAVADMYNVNEDQTLNETTGVLDNDTDAEGDTLTAVLVSDVSDGTLSLQPNGTFTYTPDANFSGTDSFTYKANDGSADSNTVTVTITVNAVNDVPVATADTYSVNEDQTLNETTGVLDNDTDADPSDTLSAVLVSDVSDGTLSLQPNGTFTYTPDANFSGTDSFTYKANDGTADSNTVTATITVNAVNDAPIAVADTYNALQNETLTVSAAEGVLSNDTDVENNPLEAEVETAPTHGDLVLNADGSFTYTPDTDFYGQDTFEYRATDNDLDSLAATVTISVGDVTPPDAPSIVLSEPNWTHTDVTATITGEAGGTIEYRIGEEVAWTVYSDEITLSEEGDYLIHARVTDLSDNVSEVSQARVRIDKTAPVIELVGESNMTVYHDSTFVDPGANVTDNLSTGLTATVTGSVYTNTIGTYNIRYNAADAAGNAAMEKNRTVHVIPKPTGLIFDATNYVMDEKETAPFTVSLNYSDGNDVEVTDLSLYSFDPEGIASIASSGVLYGDQAGTTVVEAVYGGQSVQANITVRPIISYLQFDNVSLTMRDGETRTFALEAVYTDGSTVEITDTAAYDISDTNVFSMDTTGELTALQPGTAKLKATYGSFEVELTVNVQDHSNNANLSNITLSDGTLTPAFSPGTTEYSASVAHAVTEVIIIATTEDTYATVSIDGETAVTGTQTVTVPVHVGRNKFDVEITAEDGTVQTYQLDIWRSNRGGNTPGGPNSPSSSSDDFVIIINGMEVKMIGNTVEDTAPNGQSRIIVELDTEKLEAKLREEGEHAKVIIPIPVSKDQFVTEVDGAILELMRSLQAELEIQTPTVHYVLPSQLLNLNAHDSIGSGATFQVTIASLTEEEAEQVSDHAKNAKVDTLLTPFSFMIESVKGDERVELNRFLGYVSRSLKLPEEIDPSRITTGVIVLPHGTLHHVPTKVREQDGSYYADINSLTNSAYALIYNEATFDDVQHHWSKDIVSESSSRLIVSGKSDTEFDPNSSVTRAEFVAMLNRALGISQANGQPSFQDVPRTAWYYDAVAIGEEYGLVTGFADHTFKPRATITREEAMVMMSHALKLAGVSDSLTDEQIQSLLSQFQDSTEISTWAQAAAAASIDAKIVRGSHQLLAPQSNLTRAEAATMIMGLLEAADLI